MKEYIAKRQYNAMQDLIFYLLVLFSSPESADSVKVKPRGCDT